MNIPDYIRPNQQKQFKLFEVQGFQLLVSLSGDADDEGYGLRYTVPFDAPGIQPVSMWVGSSDTSADTGWLWEQAFNEFGEAQAEEALQTVINHSAGFIKTLQGDTND